MGRAAGFCLTCKLPAGRHCHRCGDTTHDWTEVAAWAADAQAEGRGVSDVSPERLYIRAVGLVDGDPGRSLAALIRLGYCELYDVAPEWIAERLREDRAELERVADAAPEALVAWIERGEREAGGLAERLAAAEDDLERDELAAGPLEERMDYWAACRGLLLLSGAGILQPSGLGGPLDRVLGALARLDRALFGQRRVLSHVLRLPLLDNWRRRLAPWRRRMLSGALAGECGAWWLDGWLSGPDEPGGP